MRLTWKKKRVGTWGARAYELRYQGVRLATVQQSGGGADLWFWYGDGINTAGNETSLEIAKVAAAAHFLNKAPAP
jgi:hypothetical protein